MFLAYLYETYKKLDVQWIFPVFRKALKPKINTRYDQKLETGVHLFLLPSLTTKFLAEKRRSAPAEQKNAAGLEL